MILPLGAIALFSHLDSAYRPAVGAIDCHDDVIAIYPSESKDIVSASNFVWSETLEADQYHVQLASNSGMSTIR